MVCFRETLFADQESHSSNSNKATSSQGTNTWFDSRVGGENNRTHDDSDEDDADDDDDGVSDNEEDDDDDDDDDDDGASDDEDDDDGDGKFLINFKSNIVDAKKDGWADYHKSFGVSIQIHIYILYIDIYI